MKNLKYTRLLMKTVGWGMFVVFPITVFVYPEGFLWGLNSETGDGPFSPYALMLGAMYISLAIVLIRCSNNPEKYPGIFDYVIISSALHGIVMLFQSLLIPHEKMHLLGDIPMIFMLSAVFWYWHPNRVAEIPLDNK